MLCAGLGIYALALWMLNRYTWEPLRQPLVVASGQIVSSAFAVDLTAAYCVQLEVDRVQPYETLRSMLGSPDNSGTCPAVLDASFTVSDTSGEQVKTMSFTGIGSTNDTLSRLMGGFDAKAGHSYVVTLNLKRDASALLPANPRLVVREDSHIYKGSVAWAQVLAIPSLMLVTGGMLGCVVIGAIRLFRKNPHRSFGPT